MRITPIVVVVGVLLTGTIMNSAPAYAEFWGNTDCSQYPDPGCELGVGGGNGPRPSAPVPTPAPQGGNSGGDSGTLPACSYVPSGFQPPPLPNLVAYAGPPRHGVVIAVPAALTRVMTSQTAVVPMAGPSGSWYVWKCSGPGWFEAVYRPPVWIPNAGPAGAGPSPAGLALQARNQLRLLAPKIEANPAELQLVHVPTWLWMDRAEWGDVSATATVPGVSVTAVAHPSWVSWSMGDGSIVTCSGAGTSFPPGTDPTKPSPDCGYTYRASSAGQPNQAYQVTATVHWTVTWLGAGQGGVFPDMTTTSTVAFGVAESQAITTGGS